MTLIDADELFAKTLTDLMHEMGFSLERYTNDEIRITASIAWTEAHDTCWADFVQWVQFGDDEREKTRDIIRTSLELSRMWG